MSTSNKRTTRRLYALHKWTGLISGINILILSLTAAYILVERAVMGEGVKISVESPLVDESRRVPMQPIIDKLLARYAGQEPSVFAVSRAVVESDFNTIGIAAPHDRFFRFNVDVYTGVLSIADGEPPPGTMENGLPDGLVFREASPAKEIAHLSPVGDWMLALHANLFLGRLGTVLVGVIGVLFLVSTVTGLYIYAPFMKSLDFGAIRRRQFRFALADAHKVIGITSLAFNALIALTGIGITLGFFGIQYYLYHQMRGFEKAFGDFTVANPPPSFEALYAAAKTVLPNDYVYNITYPPGIQGDKSCIVYARPDPWKTPLTPTYAAVSATVVPQPMHAVTPLWVKAILMGAPIHYGEFGGRSMRVVYLLFSLTSGALSVSGFLIWFAKEKAKRKGRLRHANTPSEPHDAGLLSALPKVTQEEIAP